MPTSGENQRPFSGCIFFHDSFLIHQKLKDGPAPECLPSSFLGDSSQSLCIDGTCNGGPIFRGNDTESVGDNSLARALLLRLPRNTSRRNPNTLRLMRTAETASMRIVPGVGLSPVGAVELEPVITPPTLRALS